MSKYIKCPACKGRAYFVLLNRITKRNVMRRCECCQGRGVATQGDIIGWEMSL